MAQRRNNPRHVFAGVAAGGNAMMDSFSSAVQGLVEQPVEGFNRDGGAGLAKGMAKGVAGCVFSHKGNPFTDNRPWEAVYL